MRKYRKEGSSPKKGDLPKETSYHQGQKLPRGIITSGELPKVTKILRDVAKETERTS